MKKKGLGTLALVGAGLVVLGCALFGTGKAVGAGQSSGANKKNTIGFLEIGGNKMGLFDWFKDTTFTDTVVEGSVDIESFERLVVDNKMIAFKIETGDEFRLEYRTYEGKEPEVTQSGATLKIKEPMIKNLNIMNFERDICYRLIVPEGVKFEAEIVNTSGGIAISAEAPKDAIMESVDAGMTINGSVESTSGGIAISGIEFTGRVKSTSGGIALKNVYGGDMDVATTSGGIGVAAVKCGKLNVNSTSGGIAVSEVKCEKVDAESTSGGVAMKSVTSEGDISAISTTGGIGVVDCSGQNFEAHSKSGSVKIDEVKVNDKSIVSAISGSVKVDRCSTAKLEAESTSGSISLKLDAVDKVSAKATSGSVSIELPGRASDYGYDLACTSGGIKLDGEKYEKKYKKESAESDGKKVEVNTTSGSIKIDF